MRRLPLVESRLRLFEIAFVQIVFLHLAIESFGIDAAMLGALADVSLEPAQTIHQVGLFIFLDDLFESFLEWQGHAGLVGVGRPARAARWQIHYRDLVVRGHDGGALDGIGQLAHVTRPVVFHELAHDVGVETAQATTVIFAECTQKVFRQQPMMLFIKSSMIFCTIVIVVYFQSDF